MRVLHCIPTMQGGGTERQLSYLAEGLVKLGLDVHVALVSPGPNLVRLEASGAVIHRLGDGILGNYDPRVIVRLLSLVRALHPDLLQAWLFQMEALVCVAARVYAVPWIFSERSSELAYPPTVKNRLRTRAASRADMIVSNSVAGDLYWRSRVASRIPRVVIPNAIPAEEIAAVSPVCDNEIGRHAGRPLILAAGRLVPEKNLETLIRALAIVFEHHDAHAVLLGDGPLRSRITTLLQHRRMTDRISLRGYVPNLWAWMKRADAFVSLSQFEGNPNTVLEAIACECPVVLSDIPAHREIVDATSARFVAPQSTEETANAILSTLTDRDAARQRVRQALARIVMQTPLHIARRYTGAYADVLARNASTR
jgi:glycosyltransferase involved in cell wall biosynthesis